MTLGSIRSPAVAGSFYPESPRQLAEAVRSYLAAAQAPGDAAAPKALIAPHAGYVYSGPTAGVAYARIAPARDRIERVVLLGPAHRVPVAGLAAPDVGAFATPLGEIPLDGAALERLLELPQVSALHAAHQFEHSLEVHLPFLQIVLGSFSLVPLVVGDARPEEVAQVLESVWNGPETLIVVSSDLSHYQDYATARRMDALTARAIETLQPEDIRYDDACGRVPIQGLLVTARRKGLQAHTLDVRNSGDTAGPRDAVVGYGAWAFD
jgi:AmmeMemoRadiSam system protein B